MKFCRLVICSLLLSFVMSRGYSESYKMATTEGHSPFSGRKLRHGGLFPKIVRDVFRRAGMTAKVQFAKAAELEEQTASGKWIGAFLVPKTPEREEAFLFSDVVYTMKQRMFFHPSMATKASEVQTLRGCLSEGYSWPKDEDRFPRPLKLVEGNGLIDCFKKLRNSEVDFVVAEETIGSEAASEVGMRALASGPSLEETELYVIFSKSVASSKEVLSRFNEALRKTN